MKYLNLQGARLKKAGVAGKTPRQLQLIGRGTWVQATLRGTPDQLLITLIRMNQVMLICLKIKKV